MKIFFTESFSNEASDQKYLRKRSPLLIAVVADDETYLKFDRPRRIKFVAQKLPTHKFTVTRLELYGSKMTNLSISHNTKHLNSIRIFWFRGDKQQKMELLTFFLRSLPKRPKMTI
jgi:hypothetical protein